MLVWEINQLTHLISDLETVCGQPVPNFVTEAEHVGTMSRHECESDTISCGGRTQYLSCVWYQHQGITVPGVVWNAIGSILLLWLSFTWVSTVKKSASLKNVKTIMRIKGYHRNKNGKNVEVWK